MRKTKRRRTRDAACQTLTYRELLDDATTSSNRSKTRKNGNPTRNDTHAQGEVRVSRWSPAVDPGSPSSLATTLTAASAFQIASEGGSVHGAVIQGGRGGSSRQRRPPQQRRQGGIDSGSSGGSGSGGRLERKADRHAHARRAATARLSHQTRSEEYHANAASAWPRAREDGDPHLGQQQKQQQRLNNRHDPRPKDQLEMPWNSPPSRSESAGSARHRLSPPIGHVAVSWGEDDDDTREEPTRMRRKVAEGGDAPAGRGLGGLEHESWNVGEGCPGYPRGGLHVGDDEPWANGGQSGSGTGGGGGRGYTYTPLSKGPDYRKVPCVT